MFYMHMYYHRQKHYTMNTEINKQENCQICRLLMLNSLCCFIRDWFGYG